MARILVFYQYLYPDPNVSSKHLSELCSGLVERGWQVTGYASNRNIENSQVKYPPVGEWHGAQIRRLWRPRFSRSSAYGRILSAAWMIVRWSALALDRRDVPDVLILGTDPILSVLVAWVWRRFHPKIVIAHWCFDLYPEAAYADGLIRENGIVSRGLQFLLKPSYASCDIIVDLGPCMRGRLLKYGHSWQTRTMVPWALSEPLTALQIAGDERKLIFNSAVLALMYSGTFGRAHAFEDIFELMALLQSDSVHLALSVKGQRESALRVAAENLGNISFVPFASVEKLNDRLAAADIHVVSLREEWTGMVIPSKFFGALAIGRPILFCGSGKSSLALWIRQFRLGWVLEPGHAAEVADELRLAIETPTSLISMRERCYRTYHEHFSRRTTIDAWNTNLADHLAE